MRKKKFGHIINEDDGLFATWLFFLQEKKALLVDEKKKFKTNTKPFLGKIKWWGFFLEKEVYF